MIDITAPKYPVEVGIRHDGKVLWVNVDGKCILRICQISAMTLHDNRNIRTRRANLKELDRLTIKGEPL